MRNSHTHVVYGYPPDVAPVGDAPIQGFGRSDVQALADATAKPWPTNRRPVYYFIRSNGDRVPCGTPLANTTTRTRAARRWAGHDAKLRARYGR